MSDKLLTKSYVYIITNIINNKIYIGKANDVKDRWRKHKCIAKAGKEKYGNQCLAINVAMKELGIKNFSIEIIEECDSENEALQVEQLLVILANTNLKEFGYNGNTGGAGGVKITEETRQKLIDFQNQPEVKKAKSERMIQWHKDNPDFKSPPITEETRQKLIDFQNQPEIKKAKSERSKKMFQDNPEFLSNINKGNQYCVGREMSLETREKISKANKGKKGYNVKLTEDQVKEIRRLYKEEGYTSYKLARLYEVDPSTIYAIIKEHTWKHIL